MADVPEACPFCGAAADEPIPTYAPLFECGTYFDMLSSTNYERMLNCYERVEAQLRPKAEALDRLEEMARKSEHTNIEVFGSSAYVETDSYDANDYYKGTDYNIRGTGPDLPAAINAAYAQWKEQPCE